MRADTIHYRWWMLSCGFRRWLRLLQHQAVHDFVQRLLQCLFLFVECFHVRIAELLHFRRVSFQYNRVKYAVERLQEPHARFCIVSVQRQLRRPFLLLLLLTRLRWLHWCLRRWLPDTSRISLYRLPSSCNMIHAGFAKCFRLPSYYTYV